MTPTAMKHLAILAIALAACSKEVVPTHLVGEHKIDRKVVEMPDRAIIQIHADQDPMTWVIQDDAILWQRFNTDGVLVLESSVPIRRDANMNITKVGCRPVVEQTDSSLTWVQIEDGQDGPWYITYIFE